MKILPRPTAAFGLFLAFSFSPLTARAGPAAEAGGPKVQRIDIVHLSHTDYGFTDHPLVCREMQRRYLDIALDAALATASGPEDRKFYWTAETTIAVLDWWQAASPERREEFLKAVRSGQIEVTALPLNNTPTLTRDQWRTMVRWLPDDLWGKLGPRAAVQNDVNGFPRAGALALLDRGVRYLFTGINGDSGGAPFQRPSAFWWRMPDGRRMLAWLGLSYPSGFDFFEEREWRHGPVPQAADTRYRPPRPGEILGSGEESLRKAHRHLLGKLRGLEEAGYTHPTLILSITNQWRIDNDPPFPPLAEFVAAWNRLGLKPSLRLTTPSAALARLEAEIGGVILEHKGEWTDWWANGVASGPREVAASRLAKRLLDAARSPLWGALDGRSGEAMEAISKDLCLFDEHTWGSSNSVALPWSLDAQGQFNEKALLAWRSMARAEWLLSQRVRTRLVREGEGLYVANSASFPLSGWIRMPITSFRDGWKSLEDLRSGARTAISFESGMRSWTRPENEGELSRENTSATFPDNCPGQTARFWVEGLEENSIRAFRLSTEAIERDREVGGPAPAVRQDEQGWPVSAAWEGMKGSLFLPGFGDFLSVKVKGFAPRWILRDIWEAGDDLQREKLRKEKLEEIPMSPEGKAVLEETAHTLRFTQPFRHPRLRWGTRELLLWKREPRARLTLRLNRIPSEDPEIFYVLFPLPSEGASPRVSSGGYPFVPYLDQIPGTCMDHYSIDGWAHYDTPRGSWLWASRDAPLVAFGSPQAQARRKGPPAEMHRVLAMVYNNFWYTNFVGDCPGVMEFQFDLLWRASLEPTRLEELAGSLAAEPQVFLSPGPREDPVILERLFRP